MFSFQGASSPLLLSNQNPLTLGFSLVRLDVWVIRDSVKSQIPLGFQSISQSPNNSICEVVGQNGLEPSTSRLSVVCSSQLSYWPVFSWLTSSSGTWWRLAGSNRWPPACKAGALPAELNPHIVGANCAHSVAPPPNIKPTSLGFDVVGWSSICSLSLFKHPSSCTL